LAVNPHTRRLDRASTLFFTAGTEAWHDAGLDGAVLDPERCAIIEGSSLGATAGLLALHSQYVAEGAEYKARPSALVQFMPGAGGTMLANALDIRGPVHHLSAGSVSAMIAIGDAWERIAAGIIDIAIVGGAECPLDAAIACHFDAAGILAAVDGDASGCRPFDTHRTGTVLGEGAGALILESESHARKRGAWIRALVRGFGFARESTSLTAPDPSGAGVAASVRKATRNIPLSTIGWIKTHGTGTRLNDVAEVRGLATVFGAALPRVCLTSMKPALGHTLGASGALEAVVAILALNMNAVPATLGTNHIDPALPPCHVALTAEPSLSRTALVLAEGFGGKCAAMALEAA
jgi:3-oxoacyl-[acyl-carrier-protein] synthase II